MSFITTSPREQLMLPTSIEEYVSSDNIVRFVDAFVNKVLKNKLVILSDTVKSKGVSKEGIQSLEKQGDECIVPFWTNRKAKKFSVITE